MGDQREDRRGGAFTHGLRRLVFAAALALVIVVAASASQAQSQSCGGDEVKIGIVHATGCFETVTPADAEPFYRATQAFKLYGFTVTPDSCTHVDLIPAYD